jgi:beta-glucanase (GH16 family)
MHAPTARSKSNKPIEKTYQKGQMFKQTTARRGLHIHRGIPRAAIQIIIFAFLLLATIGVMEPVPPQQALAGPSAVEASTTMPPPAGYSKLIFDDAFSGTTLNSTKWIPQIANQYGIWNDNGKLPYPLSAVGNQGLYDAEYGRPSRVIVNDGLWLSAARNHSEPGYSWESGYITTHGKFKFSSGYVQIRAEMPDSRTGGWGALWFLEGGGEIDLQESGFTAMGSSIVNQVMAANLHTSGNTQKFYNTGVDLSAAYHIYGMAYVPGKSVTMYIDGKQVARFTSSVPTGAYTLVATMQIAQNASGWHTVVSSQTPSPLSMKITEVQVWTP